MTEIGDSILAEYASEINESIEDDKNKIRVSQGIEIARSVWRLFLAAINLFFSFYKSNCQKTIKRYC